MKLSPKQKALVDEEARTILGYRRGIRLFVEDMWGLTPQPVKPAYRAQYEELERASWETFERLKDRVTAEWWGDLEVDEVTGEGSGVIDDIDKRVDPSPDDMWSHHSIIDGQDSQKNKNKKKNRIKIPKWKWYDFQKGKHLTWQQDLILMGIEKAVANNAPRKLSTVSGHGIGKSATCSWITLWFLLCYYGAQVPVTAPTSAQMHDVLWKEISIWISKMPEKYADLYQWSKDYIRVAYAPESWFARARTSSKENTEAIAGVHSDHVAIIVDEASGVPEQVYETAQGALTSGNVFIILISNGTRPLGYFYDSHHKNREDWQCFNFNCEESPVVDRRYPDNMANQYGLDSQEYAIRVKGLFPKDDTMDDSGYIQLIPQDRVLVRTENNVPFMGRNILGVDPSGEGKDKATFVLRDMFKAAVVHERASTNPRQLAEDILTLMDRYGVKPADVVVDAFGVGADVAKEVAVASQGRYDIYSVLVGNTPKKEEEYNGHLFERKDEELQNPEAEGKKWDDLYANLRALIYFRTRKWLIGGGEVMDSSLKSNFAYEIAMNRYKRTLQGNKIQLMPKKDMAKLGIKSPNMADALSLTFLRDIEEKKAQLGGRPIGHDSNGMVLLEDDLAVGEDRFRAV